MQNLIVMKLLVADISLNDINLLNKKSFRHQIVIK